MECKWVCGLSCRSMAHLGMSHGQQSMAEESESDAKPLQVTPLMLKLPNPSFCVVHLSSLHALYLRIKFAYRIMFSILSTTSEFDRQVVGRMRGELCKLAGGFMRSSAMKAITILLKRARLLKG